jgi:hypothetical protein
MMRESWSYQTIFRSNLSGRILLLKEILSSSTTLPIEESWNHFYHIVDGTDTRAYYPNGVIIQSK